MSGSPSANRSFLHSDRKQSASEKVVYATLDSLALTRARLPLQLVPIDSNASDKSDKTERERRPLYRKSSSRRPSFKVRPGASTQWKSRHRVSLLTGKFENAQKESASRQSSYNKLINLSAQKPPPRMSNKRVPETVPDLLDLLLQTKTLFSEQSNNNEQGKTTKYSKARAKPRLESNNLSHESDATLSKSLPCMHLNSHAKIINYSQVCSLSPQAETNKCSRFSKNITVSAQPSLQCYKSSKLKSLSREELKHVTISQPTNFVHVASATNPNLISNEDLSNFERIITHEEKCADLPLLNNKECSKEDFENAQEKTNVSSGKNVEVLLVEKNEEKENDGKGESGSLSEENDGVWRRSREPLEKLCATGKVSNLEKGQGPEVVKTEENEAEEKIYEVMSEFSVRPRANSSFLWGCQQMKASTDSEKSQKKLNLMKGDGDDDAYEEYDDVGPPKESTEDDEYDDVGPPSVPDRETTDSSLAIDDEVYADVMPPSYYSLDNLSTTSTVEDNNYLIPNSVNRFQLSPNAQEFFENHHQVPGAPEHQDSKNSGENQYLSINNEYSSLEDQAREQSVYDDVGLPSQERVNSIYAGSSAGSQMGSTSNGKESEWEDLDETPPALPLPRRNCACIRSGDVQNTPGKKKLGQRWSRKVRRQRSKASRKNSSRSSSRITRDHTSTDTASDDSNYETLYSSQLDDFSSDSETEAPSRQSTVPSHHLGPKQDQGEIYGEAPSRPTPPPPREASLTQTLGRRMKMLRRTWSLTKGSLGRMRRRTTGEPECIYDGPGPKDPNSGHRISDTAGQQTDSRKYFSFKKHFRKSLSTFYLENNENNSAKNNNTNKEEIYSNSSWYAHAGLWKDDNESLRSEQSSVDHYSILAEEPLYQFYAAAAARVAFESDSDGYEEVEDVSPAPTATELTKPGVRTLWCQTPRVIQSDLLQRLTMEERKLQEAMFEILTSEASYLNSLRVLEDEFANNPELINDVLTPAEREKLFGSVSDVRIASQKFLADLEHVWINDAMLRGLPSVLLKHAEKCSNVYVKYCSNQVSIDTALKELRSRKGSRFLETISRIETHSACQSLSLHSFLMLPMQRVTRLPLLADAVLSKLPMDHTERSSWERVLSTLSQVVAECNEGARAAGRQAEMEALARKLEYSSKVTPISLRDKYLVRSGPVVQLSSRTEADYKLTFGKKFHKTQLYLLLLTDYLLVTKPKQNSHDDAYTVVDCCKRNLVALESVSDDSPWSGRHAMILTLLENYSGRETEYVLTCENDTERERWLDAVSPQKPILVGERLYESWDCPQVMAVYSYSPAQPDELHLQPGDVINVLRKMADGWNHGEKLLDGEQGWFPGNYTKEVASEHVRARNLRQRHRLLALSGSVLQQRAKQSLVIH